MPRAACVTIDSGSTKTRGGYWDRRSVAGAKEARGAALRCHRGYRGTARGTGGHSSGSRNGQPGVGSGRPIGGLGYDVRMRPDDPDTMLVTDAWAGMFMSTDGGTTWFPTNEGITTRAGSTGDAIPVFCVTVDPNDPDIVWAGRTNGLVCPLCDDGSRTHCDVWQSWCQRFGSSPVYRKTTAGTPSGAWGSSTFVAHQAKGHSPAPRRPPATPN